MQLTLPTAEAGGFLAPPTAAAIDLFCGAGGLTRGLLDAGLAVAAGFDNDPVCRRVYESNNGQPPHG